MESNASKETVRWKIILFFTLVVSGLLLMFYINQKGFRRISTIISDLSSPNEKMVALTKLQRQVGGLSDLQRSEAIKDQKEPSEVFIQEANNLKNSLDTLKILFNKERTQLGRLDRIDSLLELRNKFFIQYLEVKYNYLKKGILDQQLKKLSENIEEQNLLVDSNVVTTTKSYKTTTIVPSVTAEPDTKKKRKNKKNKEEETIQPQIIVEEKVNVRIDTLAIAQRDSVLASIEQSLHSIEQKQQKNRQFVKSRELVLLETNGLIINELMKVIREVEQQEMEQTRINNEESKELAGHTLLVTQFVLLIIGSVALVFAGMIIRDIMRINRYRKELEQAKNEAEYHSAAKQRFLANMSHEIRTPLQSIIGYAEQIADKDESTKAIYNASTHLLHVVNEVLDYSRIISGKFTFSPVDFCLQESIYEVWNSILLHPKAKGLDLQLELPEGNLCLKGDVFRLKQVLLNLLGNALKFTDEGFVRLVVTADEKAKKTRVRCEISDSGSGIEEEEQAKIFNQFEQAQNTHVTKGTGLGLSIVKELVEAQGGEVYLRSRQGEGSLFGFSITYLNGKVVQEERLEHTLPETHFEGVVWLVDDDRLILNLCARMLEKHNIRYRTFQNARELLDQELGEEVSILFADVRMPDMTGIEMTAILRKRGVKQPIYAFTAQVLPDEQEELLQQGYTGLLTKPFGEKEFMDVIYTAARMQAPLNFSSLTAMFEDEADKKMIIRQFTEDCENDLKTLEIALKEQNDEELILLVHRFGGRISQVGDTDFGRLWKEMELKLRAGITETLLQDVHSLAGMLKEKLETASS